MIQEAALHVAEAENAVATTRMTLRELRQHRGLKLRQVEGITGISRGDLSRFERGLAVPIQRQLEQLAELYAVDGSTWMPRLVYTVEVAA